MNRLFLPACIVFVVVFSSNAHSVDYHLAFEAEDFDEIGPPMKVVEDDEVSGGLYITSPQGRQGWAEYGIEIPRGAKYYMWGRVQEQDGVTDSFFITFDLPDRGADDDQNENTWDMRGPAGVWVWDRVRGRGAGGDPRVFDLQQGKRVLRFWTRENNAWLDCIYMSTDPNATPVLASEFQGEGRKAIPMLVDYAGKLAVMWGAIKSNQPPGKVE